MLNNPDLWTPRDLGHAFELVGGPDKKHHLKEARERARDIAARLKNGEVCLEIGCGFGRILRALHIELSLKRMSAKLIGVDFSASMLKLAATYNRGLTIKYLQSSEDHIPLPDESVDFIFTHAVFIHNDPEQLNKMFSECKRLLKRDGHMRHDFVNGDNELGRNSSKEALDSDFPLYYYSRSDIEEISRTCGFDIIEEKLGGKSGERIWYEFK